MADPLLSTEQEAPAYRPLSGLAIAGFALAGLYAVAVALGAVVCFFQGSPLLLSDWLMLAPLAGFILSYLGARQIHDSEGTRAGLVFTKYGMWLSAVCGLCYFIYVKGTGLAITQQANAFLMEIQADSGLFPRLQRAKHQPVELNAAFLLNQSPARKHGADPNDDAAMRQQFDQSGPDGSPGDLTRFREFKWVQLFLHYGENIQVEPLAVQNWGFEKGGYRVKRTYRIATPEAVHELMISVQSVEGTEAGARRLWMLAPPLFPEVSQPKLTPQGQTLQAFRVSAKNYMGRWAADGGVGKLAFKDLDRTKWDQVVPDPQQREALRSLLHAPMDKADSLPPWSLQPSSSKDEDFVPWEKDAGRLRLSFKTVLKSMPKAGSTPFVCELLLVLETQDDAPGPATVWAIHHLEVKHAMIMKSAPKGPE